MGVPYIVAISNDSEIGIGDVAVKIANEFDVDFVLLRDESKNWVLWSSYGGYAPLKRDGIPEREQFSAELRTKIAIRDRLFAKHLQPKY